MYPISSLVMGFSNGILRLFFGVKPDEQPTVFKRVDLDHFLRERTEDNTDLDQVDTEVQYLQNALDFDKVKVRDCLIPRTEIVALDVSDEVEALRDKFYETGLGKILIYRGSIDEIIGYVHSFELFKKPKSIRNILLPVPIVPETMPARELLNMLLSEHKSLAVVVDEFGGTAGLVTVEDVIEEIFGDIEDEHDSEERVEEILAEDKYRFSARLEIDYINTTYKLDLPEGDDYETLGGLVVKVHESIPEVGERIVYEHFTFTIVRSTSRRIEEVILKVHRDD
jgi:CBS domain containing-hemolysin-like protein